MRRLQKYFLHLSFFDITTIREINFRHVHILETCAKNVAQSADEFFLIFRISLNMKKLNIKKWHKVRK